MDEVKGFEAGRNRRTSRVKYDVLVELKDERFAYAGETVVVNLHGALIRSSAALDLGSPVIIHVQQTGKAAPAKVVFASYDRPPHYGVELESPDNIWGITDAPPDWQVYLN